jgi:hypothetical protein
VFSERGQLDKRSGAAEPETIDARAYRIRQQAEVPGLESG